MFFSSRQTAVLRLFCVMIVAAIGLTLTSSPSHGQEQERWKLFVTPPENARRVWSLQARHVASELELDREAARQLMRTYFSARQEHLEKVEALPKTAESMRQFWEIRGEASSALEKSLVEAFGKEKGQKAATALGAFNFLTDHMVADIVAAQQKALSSVFKYQEGVNKAIKEAQEAGSWEGMREKFTALGQQLASNLSAVFSEEQTAKLKEKYPRIFGEGGSR